MVSTAFSEVVQAPAILKKGTQLPAIVCMSVDEKSFDSRTILAEGKYLIVTFFTTYCQPCIKEFPSFLKIKQEAGNNVEILLVSVGQDSRDDLKRFRLKHNIPGFEMVRDKYSTIRQPFGVTDKVPVTFMANPKGEVIFSQFGAFPNEDPYPLLKPLIKGTAK